MGNYVFFRDLAKVLLELSHKMLFSVEPTYALTSLISQFVEFF